MDAALRLCRLLSRIAYGVDRPHRRRTMEHIRLVYEGELSDRQMRDMARRVFETLGRHICEATYIMRRPNLLPRLQNAEALLKAYALGRGVVIITAHLGSFGLLNLIPRHLRVRTAVIVKRQKNSELLEWISGTLRNRLGVEVILKPDARKQVPELLRRGYLVTFFADQHPAGGGVSGRFLSQPALVPAGPTVFAKRCQAPIIVGTVVADGEHRSVACFSEAVSTDGSLEEVTMRWNRILEERIREHPEQWMWMHRRWRQRDAETR